MKTHTQSFGKMTRNQKLVLATLHEAEIPLSAYSILDNLRAQGLRAPLQIYRALEKLIVAGQVHRLESLNSFVACRHSNCDQKKAVVFAICSTCERVVELTNNELSSTIKNIACQYKFELERSIVELQGCCESCARETGN